MFDKLKDFLNSQTETSKEEKNKNLAELWNRKEKLVNNLLIDFITYLAALKGTKETGFKATLEEILNNETSPGEKKHLSVVHKNRHVKQSVNILPDKLKDEDIQIQIFKLFLSNDYEPPTDPDEILIHLFSLHLYYTYLIHAHIMPEIPLTVALRIDYVMTRLVSQAMTGISSIIKIGKKRDSSSQGGKRSATRKGIELAINEILTEKSHLSREQLWLYFRNSHNENYSIDFDEYEIYHDGGKLCQRFFKKGQMNEYCITKGTFFKYVSRLRKKAGV